METETTFQHKSRTIKLIQILFSSSHLILLFLLFGSGRSDVYIIVLNITLFNGCKLV